MAKYKLVCSLGYTMHETETPTLNQVEDVLTDWLSNVPQTYFFEKTRNKDDWSIGAYVNGVDKSSYYLEYEDIDTRDDEIPAKNELVVCGEALPFKVLDSNEFAKMVLASLLKL